LLVGRERVFSGGVSSFAAPWITSQFFNNYNGQWFGAGGDGFVAAGANLLVLAWARASEYFLTPYLPSRKKRKSRQIGVMENNIVIHYLCPDLR
jgi:hypothetical protein